MNTAGRDADPALRQLRKKMDEARSRDYLPAPLVALVGAVAEVQLAARQEARFAGCEPGALPAAVLGQLADAASRRLGAPLLPRRAFPLDMGLASRLIPVILQAVGEHAPHLGLWKEELEQRLRSAPALLESACRELLLEVPPRPAEAGRAEGEADIDPDTAPLAEWEETRPEAAFLFRFVALSAVMPSLHVAGELLGKHLDSTRAWPHGHCPVCGSLPLIGRLAGNWEGSEGARLHTCSFCLHEYRVPRLGCPFCLAAPGEESRYYASDEEPGYLLDVCDSCHQYIKLADFRECDRPWLPALDDLISLALDAYARSQGYERPTLSAWGF